jgi:hypothetical protein
MRAELPPLVRGRSRFEGVDQSAVRIVADQASAPKTVRRWRGVFGPSRSRGGPAYVFTMDVEGRADVTICDDKGSGRFRKARNRWFATTRHA